jgi:hypothetical protein
LASIAAFTTQSGGDYGPFPPGLDDCDPVRPETECLADCELCASSAIGRDVQRSGDRLRVEQEGVGALRIETACVYVDDAAVTDDRRRSGGHIG